jgi:MraZ protein
VFVGAFERQLDDRGRVALPAPFRSLLGDHCYVFYGDDGCVSVRSEQSFDEQANELIQAAKRGEISRDRLRAFSSSAVHAAIDKQGRLTIDPKLRDHAAIAPSEAVIVLGSLDKVEIWEPDAYRASTSAGQAEIVGERRSTAGVG